MPYFQRPVEYKCPNCGGWFMPSNRQCLVAHAPGTCCHEYENRVSPPVRVSHRLAGVAIPIPPPSAVEEP